MASSRQGIPPRRIDDIEYYSQDKLVLRFAFKDTTGQPVDLSFVTLKAVAHADNHPVVEQPILTVGAIDGLVNLSWSAAQVATLPMYFLLTLRGSGAEAIDSLLTWDDLGNETWGNFPEVIWSQPDTVGEGTWDELAEFDWDDLIEETFQPTAFWDRSVVLTRLTRNDAGQRERAIGLDDRPVVVVVSEAA